jgi:hypothetical protein
MSLKKSESKKDKLGIQKQKKQKFSARKQDL